VSDGRLDGRVAVVTGGGRGIGRAIARRYAAEGAAVVISSRTGADLDEVVADIEAAGRRAVAVVADATDPEGARLPVRRAMEALGRIDVLVNNVGGSAGRGHDPFHVDGDGFEQTLVLCLTSAWWTTTEALPHLRAQGRGTIVNIGSGASKRAAASVAYTAAKHGLIGFTRAMAAATAEHGITVNCLCPGWTNTSLLDWERTAAGRGVTVEEAQTVALADNLQHRILEPEELTGMAVLLASDDGRGITGQVLSVDGGYRV